MKEEIRKYRNNFFSAIDQFSFRVSFEKCFACVTCHRTIDETSWWHSTNCAYSRWDCRLSIWLCTIISCWLIFHGTVWSEGNLRDEQRKKEVTSFFNARLLSGEREWILSTTQFPHLCQHFLLLLKFLIITVTQWLLCHDKKENLLENGCADMRKSRSEKYAKSFLPLFIKRVLSDLIKHAQGYNANRMIISFD